MPAVSGRMTRKSLDSPDERRPFEGSSGELNLVNTDEGAIGRARFRPGWKWSDHVKPIAKTESCEAAHVGYMVSGAMRVRMDDGSEEEFRAGDAMIIPPGHDAWVVGDQDCVVIDWTGFTNYAKR
jgi:quercetin dioxygenase-like cupin family protein